ncbi:MAG: phytoene desaturase family protein, partial [Actinomycetota bacterium]
WYVRGGLGALRDALVRVAQRCGVEMHANTEVSAIVATNRRVAGVRVAQSGEAEQEFLANVIVCNADAEHLYRDLLPHARRLKEVQHIERSTSGIAVMVGVEGRTPLVAHHNVWFSRDYDREFRDIAEG